MHTGAFAAAGQRLADTDDSFSSAPRGILIGQIPEQELLDDVDLWCRLTQLFGASDARS